MSDKTMTLWRPTRRRLLGTGAAALAAPMILGGRARAKAEPLKFWQFYAPGGDVPAQVNWFTSLVDDWNASHEQPIALEFVPSSEYMGGKLTTAFASGEGPDIFLVSPGDFLRYYNGGALLDLTPYIEAQDFVPSVLASRMVDERVFGVPMEVEPMAMFYSIKAFEEAGLNETDVPTTWDELLAVADKLTNDQRYGVLFDVTPGFYQNFTWYPFMWQAGGAFQTQDGASAFGSDGVVRALALWKDAVDMGVAPRQVLGGGGWDTVPNLGSGYCAIQNVGVWGMAQMDSGAPDVPYGVFQLPRPADGKNVSVGGGWAFCANARGRNPEAAGEFCGWALASQEPGSVERIGELVHGRQDQPAAAHFGGRGRQGHAPFGQDGDLQPGHPADGAGRTARAARSLQDHLGRHPGGDAGRRRARGRGGERVRAARRLPCHL